MSLLLALLFTAGEPPEIVVDRPKPKMRCERVHEVGSIRSRRVCVPLDPEAERARRDAAEKIREQADREKQLDKDNLGEKPL